MFSKVLENRLNKSINAKKEFINNSLQLSIFQSVVEKLIDVYKKGGRLYIAGNGGSAADSQHLAAEFVSKLALERNPLPAEALTVDTSILTAIGNDYGFEHIFSRQIIAKVSSKDIFLGITTSGNSKNIINAFSVCRSMSVPSILLTGSNGGSCRELADYVLCVPQKETALIQEVHIVIAHALCECVEIELFS
jgi:D-sedoheptulose 7-phosphate isomerase